MSLLDTTDESKYIDEITQLKNRICDLEKIEEQYKISLHDLQEKEAFNFALFQYNPVFMIVVDLNGRVVKSNYAKRFSGDRLPEIGTIMYKDYASKHEIDMYSELMEAIKTQKARQFNELKYDKKYLSITIAPFPKGAIIASQDITERKNSENDRLKLISDLQHALQEVETLRGLLPICAGCKKIRDDQGYWNHIETYFSKHSGIDFTHTLCPDCIQHYYPEYWQQMQELKAQQCAKK